MPHNHFRLGALIGLATILGGCSVFMAADKKGIAAETILACRTKACLSALAYTEVIDEAELPDGGSVVTYKTLLAQGSTTRAVLHGLLDISTLGLWEVAGTPIEVWAFDNKYLIYNAHFSDDDSLERVNIKSHQPQRVAERK